MKTASGIVFTLLTILTFLAIASPPVQAGSGYRTSPPLANFLATHAWARPPVRMALAPVVFAVENPATALLLGCMAPLGAAWAVRLWRRRRSAVPGAKRTRRI